jgi:uncharacterized damage-inducible protein DinB
MTETDRAKLIRLFETSRSEFLDALRDVSDSQWNLRRSTEQWSIGELAEHIVLAEDLLFRAARSALSMPENPDWQEKTARKTEFIERVMPETVRRAKAPESLVPGGRFTLEQAVESFEAGRARIVRFVSETDADVYRHTAEHPFPVFGTLNAFQWLLYIPLHTQRHVKQIVALKPSVG